MKLLLLFPIIAILLYGPIHTPPTKILSPYAERRVGSRNVSIPVVHIIHGKASWYGSSQAECFGCSSDRITASGEKFDDLRFTAACAQRFSLGQTLEVRYGKKMVRVKCTDRGGFEKSHGRILDLSKAAFAELAPLSRGVIEVEVKE